jgi:hypothetical protein
MRTLSGFVTRYFYVLLGALAIVIVHIGFSRTYISPVFNGTFSGRKILHVHGVVFMAWLVLCTVQPLLIRQHKFTWHRRLGTAGFVLALIITFFGLYLGISAVHINVSRGAVQAAKEFLIIPITDMMLFATFAALALRSVHNPEAHKRYIVLATLSILPAATARTFSLFTWWTENPVIDTLLALLIMEITLYIAIVHDVVVKRKVHPVYLWGGLCILFIHGLRDFAAKSDLWMSISDWILKHT